MRPRSFFAGHGVEIGGLNFLLPRDVPRRRVRRRRSAEGLWACLSASVLEQVRERKPQIGLYIVDACRDILPYADAKGQRALAPRAGLARVEPPSGTFIMFSAGARESALDRPVRRRPAIPTPCTRARLLPELKGVSGKSLTDIARDVRRDVRETAQTVDHVQTPAYYDEVVGEFCPAGCESGRGGGRCCHAAGAGEAELHHLRSAAISTETNARRAARA